MKSAHYNIMRAMPRRSPPPAGAFAAARERLRKAHAAGDLPAACAASVKLAAADREGAWRQAYDLWLKPSCFPRRPPGPRAGPWERFYLAAAAWQAGGTEEALALLRSAAKAASPLGWMRYFAADMLLRRRTDAEGAAKELAAVSRSHPWLWEARCLRAEALFALGQGERAAADLARVKVRDPFPRTAFLAWRGAILTWMGRFDRGRPDLDFAAAEQGHDAFCWRGANRASTGDLEGALSDLDRLLQEDPADQEALVWRGEVLRRLGRPEESRRDLDEAIALAGDTRIPWAYANRSLLRLAGGDESGGLSDYFACVDIMTRSAPPPDGTDPRAAARALEEAFRLARGCRRNDPHLNLGWMRAAGLKLSSPQQGAIFRLWFESRGAPMPSAPYVPESVPG